LLRLNPLTSSPLFSPPILRINGRAEGHQWPDLVFSTQASFGIHL
jgi:hypothetical protein